MKKVLAYTQKESVIPAVSADPIALQIKQMTEIVGQNMAKLTPFQQQILNFISVQQADKIMPQLLFPKSNVADLVEKMKDDALLSPIQESAAVAKASVQLSPNIKHTEKSVTFQFLDKTEKCLSDSVQKKLYIKFKNVNKVLIKIIKDPEISELNRTVFQNLMYGDLQDENHPGDLLFIGIANILKPDGLMQVLNKNKSFLINIRISEIQHEIKSNQKEIRQLQKRAGSEKQIKEINQKQVQLQEKIQTFQAKLGDLKRESLERNQLGKRVYFNINLITQQVYYLLKNPLKLLPEDKTFLGKLLGQDYVEKKIACNPLYQEKNLDLKEVQQYLNGKSVADIQKFGVMIDMMYHFPKKLSQEEKELLVKLLGETFVRRYVSLPKHKK